MKVLMLTPYFPYPPYSGGQTRSFNLIKNLGKKHQITLFSFIRDDKEKRFLKKLSPYCKQIKLFKRRKAWAPINIFFTGFSLYPFLASIYFSREVKEIIRQELERGGYDLIHVETFYLMPEVPKTDVPILLVDQTIEYRVYQHFVEALPWFWFFIKPFLWIDVVKLKFWEKFYWKKADMTVAVSQEDKKLMESLVKKLKVEIVPNGVDEVYFSKKIFSRAKEPVVLFGVANFKWMQNREGARLLIDKVWPLIKQEVPKAKLWIIGRHAPEFLSGLKSDNVLVREVKEPREVYQQAWVSVAPMKSGGGSRTKFFEAMASGLPIVTTQQGKEGIEARDGEEIFIADDFQKLARKTVRILQDKTLIEKIGRKSKDLVKKKYSWRKSAQELDKVYQEVVGGQKS